MAADIAKVPELQLSENDYLFSLNESLKHVLASKIKTNMKIK